MLDFLGDDDYMTINADDIIAEAFESEKTHHRMAILHERQRRQMVIDEKENAIMEKELFRINRRAQREQRKKDEERKKLRE